MRLWDNKVCSYSVSSTESAKTRTPSGDHRDQIGHNTVVGTGCDLGMELGVFFGIILFIPDQSFQFF